MFRRWLTSHSPPPEPPAPRKIGDAAEEHALRFLLNKGLRLRTRNYRVTRGEIDLIMDDGATLVFVEVRYRRTQAYGGGAESVDRKKQAKLRRAAEHYLSAEGTSHRGDCRFDVVAVGIQHDQPQIEWIKDAFEAND